MQILVAAKMVSDVIIVAVAEAADSDDGIKIPRLFHL